MTNMGIVEPLANLNSSQADSITMWAQSNKKNNNNRGKEFRYVTYIQQLNYPYWCFTPSCC